MSWLYHGLDFTTLGILTRRCLVRYNSCLEPKVWHDVQYTTNKENCIVYLIHILLNFQAEN